MKQNITLSIDEETKDFLKKEAQRRNISVKKVGEEYFELLVRKLQIERQYKTNTL
jgi:hypothetical protein